MTKRTQPEYPKKEKLNLYGKICLNRENLGEILKENFGNVWEVYQENLKKICAILSTI